MLLNAQSLDPQSRAILRYALETNDPWLAKLVRQAESDETIVASRITPETETCETQTRDDNLHALREDRIETLAEMICRGADESPGALLVLMGMLETSGQPNVLANKVKQYAFARCGELNLFGMVDAQIAVLESELFLRDTLS